MIALLLSVLSGLSPVQGGDAPVDPVRELRVFRCVLDGRARMLTVALREDFWLGYDAGLGSLYGAWTGGVLLEGAVYDTVHGPQPTVQGPLLMGVASGGEVGEPDPWLLEGGAETEPEAVGIRYRGYRLDHPSGAGLELHWELSLAGGGTVDVRERPMDLAADPAAARHLPDGTVGLRRTLEVSGLPSGQRLRMFSGLWTGPEAALASRAGSSIESAGFSSKAGIADRMRPADGAAGSAGVPWYVSFGNGEHALDIVMRPVVAPEAGEDSEEEAR